MIHDGVDGASEYFDENTAKSGAGLRSGMISELTRPWSVAEARMTRQGEIMVPFIRQPVGSLIKAAWSVLFESLRSDIPL